MIDDGVRLGRRPHAQRQRDQHGERQREEGQLDRCGQSLEQIGQHGLAGRERVAEIALAQVIGVVEELHRKAAIETELRADFGDRCLVGRGAREVGGGVSRQRMRQQESHQDDADEAGDGAEQSLPEEMHAKRGESVSIRETGCLHCAVHTQDHRAAPAIPRG